MTLVPIVSPTAVVFFALAWVALVVWGARPFRPLALPAVFRLSRRLALGLVLAIALLGPSVPAEESEVTSNVEVYFTVDRTGSMAAEDWVDGKPRLDGVRRDMAGLVTATAGSRYAIVTWDSSARMELPMTTDSSAVISFTEALHQEISEYSSGSSINRPVEELQRVLTAAKESRPENIRYLVVFSDGESTDPVDTGVSAVWSEVGGLIDGGAVIGYGTEAGAPMQIYRAGQGQTGEYMMDPDNPEQKALSRFDPDTLAKVAEALNVPKLVNPSAAQVGDLGATLMKDSQTIDDGRKLKERTRYLVWPLGLVGAILVMGEAAAFARKAGRMRRSHAI